MLRGKALTGLPFFDRSKVIGLLDRLYAMDDGSRVANDQILMMIASACVLNERYRMAA
jgi:asparagine synthase (glutamine-hydrolysing)